MCIRLHWPFRKSKGATEDEKNERRHSFFRSLLGELPEPLVTPQHDAQMEQLMDRITQVLKLLGMANFANFRAELYVQVSTPVPTPAVFAKLSFWIVLVRPMS